MNQPQTIFETEIDNAADLIVFLAQAREKAGKSPIGFYIYDAAGNRIEKARLVTEPLTDGSFAFNVQLVADDA